MNKICCFAGHAELYDTEIIYMRLVSEFDELIEKQS